jgi:hypothetical protein
LLLAALLTSNATAQQSGPVVEDFHEERIGADPTSFAPEVGFWSISVDADQPVMLEDGSRWEGSDLANSLAAQAQSMYGSHWAEFIDDLEVASYWPLAVFNKVETFGDGTLSVRFKVLGGDADQDCGIAFAIQPNGDFLAVKSDTQENDVVVYQSVQGQVLTLQRIDDVPTSIGEWHEQRLLVSGKHLTVQLDGTVWLDTDLPLVPTGRVGLFAKRDTVATFTDFSVEPAQTPAPAGLGFAAIE